MRRALKSLGHFAIQLFATSSETSKIKEADPKKNQENVLFCHKAMTTVLEGTKLADVGLVTVDPFEYRANQMQTASDHGAPLQRISAKVQALP